MTGQAAERPIRNRLAKSARWLLVAAAAGLALATLASFLASHWWVFDLTTHFRLQFTLAAIAGAVMAVALGQRVLAAVMVVLSLPHLVMLTSLLRAEAGAAAGEAAAELRVTTINVHWNNGSKQDVLDYVREVDADILVVQEAGRRWRRELREIAAHYADVAPAGWHDGTPLHVFSKYPILSAMLTRPEGSRFPFLESRIDVDGQPVSLIVVHAPYPASGTLSRQRGAYLTGVARAVDGRAGPVIVAGDFNTTTWSPHFGESLGRARLVNTADGRGWLPTWPTWLPAAGIAIDLVLVSDHFAVRDVRLGPHVGSDHYPVSTDLALRRMPE